MVTRREVLAGTGAALLAGCTESSPDGPSRWPQVHYDAANTGYAPDGGLPDEVEETSSRLDDYPVTSAVATEDSSLFALPDRHLARGSLDEGLAWPVRPAEGRTPTGTYALGSDHVYVTEGTFLAEADAPALLRALELDTGAEAWRREFDDRFLLAPTLHEGTLYVRSETGIHAVATDGERRWSRERPVYEVEGFDVAKDVSPAVGGGAVYVPNPSGVSAHDAETGEQLWDVPIEKVRASPAYAGDTVLISSVRSGVMAVDAADGSERWTWPSGHPWTSPAVAEGTVYAADEALVALDLDSGDEQWRYDVRGDVFGSPIVVGETVVVTSIDLTAAFDREGGFLDDPGEEKWTVGVGSMFTPAAVDGRLVVPSLTEELWEIG